ncbi:unnamed protein product, partial [Boreogadus saida]
SGTVSCITVTSESIRIVYEISERRNSDDLTLPQPQCIMGYRKQGLSTPATYLPCFA